MIRIQHVTMIDLVQGRTTVKEDGGIEADIILSRPGCMCAEGGETHTGINSGGSSNDNMPSDFSTPQFHTINDVWFAKTIIVKYVLYL